MNSNQKMQDLAQDILNILNKVEAGNASLDEVETLYTCSRSLYERAILLKAKAFSGAAIEAPEVEQPKEAIVSQPVPEKKEPPTQEKDVKPAEPKESAPLETPKKEAPKDLPLFDFTAMNEDEEPKEEKTEEPEKKEGEQVALNDHQDVFDSINDVYKTAEDNSLLEDMKRQPITHLRTAIGINDKFSYINDLFNGENQLYEVAIDQLEGLQDADQAKHKLSELAIANEWDLESKTVMQFVELVERRYATPS